MKDKCWEGMKMSQEATNHKVDIGDMQGIFFLLAIGIGNSCFATFCAIAIFLSLILTETLLQDSRLRRLSLSRSLPGISENSPGRRTSYGRSCRDEEAMVVFERD